MRSIRKGQPHHRWWLTLSLIAALALLTACTGTTVVGHATPSATATPTPLPAMPLSWQTGTLPPGVPPLGTFKGPVTVAPSDGGTAYALRVPQNGSQVQNPEVWVTHDRAAHWTRIADVPVGRSYTIAWLVVDSINPEIVVVVISWADPKLGPLPQLSANYMTFDGGASWQRLTGPQPFEVEQLATRNGVTFAILLGGIAGGSFRPEVSTDRMRTWQPVAEPGGLAIESFWINPVSGEILAPTGTDPEQLWTSPDNGQHWTQMTMPALDPISLVVAPPVADQPWRMCGLTPHPDNPDGGKLMCSLDGGKTWQERPRIHYTESGAGGSFPRVAQAYGVAGDGTLLSGVPDPNTLYQLKPGASVWQSLGPEPQAPLATATLPGGEMLWEGGSAFGPYPAG